MTRLEEAQSTVAQWLGLQPKSRLDRLRELDWHDYVPTRQTLSGLMPMQRRNIEWDTTSLVVGLVVGVSIGVGVGIALSRTGRPALSRARRQVSEAIDRVEERMGEMPGRLNITRMEDQQVKK